MKHYILIYTCALKSLCFLYAVRIGTRCGETLPLKFDTDALLYGVGVGLSVGSVNVRIYVKKTVLHTCIHALFKHGKTFSKNTIDIVQ